MADTVTASTKAAPTEALSIDTSSIETYRYMRRGLMIVAFLLPLVLWGWGSLRFGGLWPQSSMSYYYYYGGPYGGARDVFVGALWAIGVFLILYQTENRFENRLLNLAGIAACLIALIPMNEHGDCGQDQPWSVHSLHGLAAAVFFIAISVVCWRYPAKQRPKGSKVCAVVMLVTIAFAFAYYFLLERALGVESKRYVCGWSPVFLFEFVAVYAFAFYWYFKIQDETNLLARWVSLGVAFNDFQKMLPDWARDLWNKVTQPKQ
jgi:hypothetical protein